MKRRLDLVIPGVALCLTALLAGCSTVLLGPNKKAENVPGLRVNAEQLRVRMRVMVKPLTGVMIEAADTIYDATDDPEVRRAAVRMKTEVVPAIRETLYRPAPAIALLDTWALSFQLMDYFRTGPGAEVFGDLSPIAFAAAAEMNTTIEDLVENLASGEVDQKSVGVLRQWATDNPITVSIASRESVTNQVTEISLAIGLSLSEVVDNMVTSVDDLNRKLDTFSDQLPKQARWEAELFTMNLVDAYRFEESLQRVPALLDQSVATLEVVESIPEVVASERAIVLETVQDEMARALTTLREERIAVMDQLSRERALILAEVEAQRLAVTMDLRRELMAIEAMFARERKTVLEGTEDLRERLIADAFNKVLVVLLLMGIYLAGLTFAILRFVGRRNKNPAT
ncbi:MAG: hypothetical protein R3F07_12410 [Opitutaceae bacterium]